MKTLLYLLVLSFSTFSIIKAQTVMVNSDGTHSIGINHGSTTTVINPDGTVSVGHNHGGTIIAVHADGTHSVGINHGGTVDDVHPDGTHSIGHNPDYESTDHDLNFSGTFFTKSPEQLLQEDSLFTVSSGSYKEEVQKLKILIERDIIRYREYRALKKLSLENTSRSTFDKANQVFELHKLLNTKAITDTEFRLGKSEIIEANYH